MDARELFNDAVFRDWGCGERYGDWTKNYWELEYVIADTNGCHYSDLESYFNKDERTCELCGTLHDTNERGFISFCNNKTCADLRVFFYFTHGKRPHISIGNGKNGSTRHKRITWLRNKLSELYGRGGGQIYERYSVYSVPIDCRIAMLLSMQIAREQIENVTDSGNAVRSTDSDAAEPKQRKQAESCTTYASGGSIY